MRSDRSSANAPASASNAHKLAASSVSSPATTASRFSRLMLSICVALLRDVVLALMGLDALVVAVEWLLLVLLVSSFRDLAMNSSRGSNQSGSMPNTDGMGLNRPTELAFEDARCRKSGDNWKPLDGVRTNGTTQGFANEPKINNRKEENKIKRELRAITEASS